MRTLAIGFGLLAVACTADPLELGAVCDLNSDCNAPLVCRLGKCRNECASARDCPLGTQCRLDEQGLGACLVEPDLACTDTAGNEDTVENDAGQEGTERHGQENREGLGQEARTDSHQERRREGDASTVTGQTVASSSPRPRSSGLRRTL